MSETEAPHEKVLSELRAEFASALETVQDAKGLQQLKDRFLGRRSGRVTALLKGLKTAAKEERRALGQALNSLKSELEQKLESAKERLESKSVRSRLSSEGLDLTLPGRSPSVGRIHPLTGVREEVEDIFVSMGYEVYDGPEVDDDFHCFEALNMPPDHPARDMQDTFYLRDSKLLLRTHTSTGQIRYMLDNDQPPEVRIICPGKVYRRDNDITHSPLFHQVEGLVVGKDVTLGDLKGTIEAFLHRMFGEQYPIRFRSSYFPYTEPSMEADLQCIVCAGEGCRVCSRTGWLEILGSGMVDPAVYEAVNGRLGKVVYDPEEVTGFAFGLGIDRLAMVRHGIDDIRLFYGSDLRFLEQFDP